MRAHELPGLDGRNPVCAIACVHLITAFDRSHAIVTMTTADSDLSAQSTIETMRADGHAVSYDHVYIFGDGLMCRVHVSR